MQLDYAFNDLSFDLILFFSLLSAQTRIFTSKDIVRQTRRKYQKLPEIRHRRQVENDKKIRRNQRMLATIFNKVRLSVHDFASYCFVDAFCFYSFIEIDFNLWTFAENFFFTQIRAR